MRHHGKIGGLLFMGVALMHASLSHGATYSGGSGTETDPYQIGIVSDWIMFSTTPDDWNKYFLLTADIDFEGAALNPIGTYPSTFSGWFDGAGHVLRNAVIDKPDTESVGLFSRVGLGGAIDNLGVENVSVTGKNNVGVLVGSVYKGTVSSCYASGAVTGKQCVGGLVGRNNWEGSVTSCSSNTVTGDGDGTTVGGLVGYNDSGTIMSCYATGTVTGDYEVGGLAGRNSGTVTLSYASGAVTGGDRVGGLVGPNGGTITSCYATGTVMGNSYVGGLTGSNSSGTVTLCYASGAVTGGDWVGGLVGYNGGTITSTITSCYATCTVTGNSDVGGLVGCNTAGPLMSCYASGAVTGIDDGIGGLVGWNVGGTLTSCHSTAMVTGSYDVGGLVGSNSGNVTFCYATSAVTANHHIGGLMGSNLGIITSCYASGAVTANSNVGGLVVCAGLVGSNGGTITSCYTTGIVTSDLYNWSVGGLVGKDNFGTVTSCYWDVNRSGQSTSGGGGEGRTTTEMTYPYAINTYVDWDFTAVWTEDTDYSVNNGYPFLRENVPPEEGEGEPVEGEGEIAEGEGEDETHAADLNGDWRMAMSEAIAYLSGWQQGTNPMGYAIRAAYLWQNGEQYIYDLSQEPPMCWVLAP